MRGYIIISLIALLLLSACKTQVANPTPFPAPTPQEVAPTPGAVIPPEPAQTGDPRCPVCNDGNSCTQDVCNQQTNFECRTIPISPCCGNTVCESGETTISCSKDCTDESPALKELIVAGGQVTSYSYTYENYAGDTISTSYKVLMLNNLTQISYDKLQSRNGFAYDKVLVNGTGDYSVIYCDGACGITKKAVRLPGVSQFAQSTPVEILHSMKSATVICL